MSVSAQRPPSRSSDLGAAYPNGSAPRTPLEYRHGPHPKKVSSARKAKGATPSLRSAAIALQDFLLWKTPPSRQLSREKRREFECDVQERFYDDYIGVRNTGDASNEVLVKTTKQSFNPDDYKLNALQGLAYDPARTVPKTVDFSHLARVETAREKERTRTRARQRRLSDSQLPSLDYSSQFSSMQLPPVHNPMPLTYASDRPRSATQKNMDDALNPDVVPQVEKWMQSADKKDREAAEKFLRTISSQGQRPDPATKASKHTTRVRSAVMTPSRAQRQEEREVKNEYRQLERDVAFLAPPSSQIPPAQKRGPEATKRKIRRSQSEVVPKGTGMFTSTKQRPGHFSIHPDWASEALDRY